MRLILLCCLLAFHAVPAGATTWDYEYLNLDDLMALSDLIVIAQIAEIQEKLENKRVIQEVTFSAVRFLKGKLDAKSFPYHASFLPDYYINPESHYIDAPPGTKFLLFLTKRNNSYESVLGPCGALEIQDNKAAGGFGNQTEQVLWYTDDSKPQRFVNWENISLQTAINRITEKVEQVKALKP